jgi:hypothetical protein
MLQDVDEVLRGPDLRTRDPEKGRDRRHVVVVVRTITASMA